jgi:multicomponent Na+:H+ antiporter subunit D
MVELGIYAAARVYWTVYSGALALNQHSIGLVLIGGGVASIGVGSLMCFLQQHIKRLLAFSTIAHAGIAVVGLGLMSHEALAGAAVYVAGHGLVKASLFVLAGVLLHRFSSLDDEYLRGRARGMPFVGVLFAIGGLALAGLPPFGMEAGKALIEEAGKQYSWLPWVLGFGGAMTGAAVLRVAGRVFVGWGPKSRRLFASKAYATGVEGRETTSHFDRTPFVLVFPAVALLLAGLAVGLIPHLEEHAAVAAARFVDRIGYARAVLASSDHLVTPVTHKTSFSAVIYALAASAAAVGLAGAALARESIARPVRSLLRPVAIPILALRRAHSGHVGDYVMWYTVGLAAMGGLFFIAVR